MRYPRRRKVVMLVLALSLMWVVTSAESCDKSLHKADQGLTAIQQTCAEALGDETNFVTAEADQANLPAPLDQTEGKASTSLHAHCDGSQNADYQPYSDVQIDIIGGG